MVLEERRKVEEEGRGGLEGEMAISMSESKTRLTLLYPKVHHIDTSHGFGS